MYFTNADSPIAEHIQQTFLDDLLNSYRKVESHFAMKLYRLYKGFEFQSLWNVKDKIAEYQRLASSAEDVNGKLRGVLELSKALQAINDIESKARDCFTNFHHSTDTHKWSFDKKTHAAVCNHTHLYTL